MKKWTWEWLVLLAFLGALFSCGAWIDKKPYHIYEDVYKPDTPSGGKAGKVSKGNLSPAPFRETQGRSRTQRAQRRRKVRRDIIFFLKK